MRVKVCGIKRLEDALLSAKLGAWAVGFIFYKKSPRFISPKEASLICEKIPSEIKKVGVFVNASVSEISRFQEEVGLTAIQLHGDETPEFCLQLRDELKQTVPVELFKSFSLRVRDDLNWPLRFTMVDHVLVDSVSKEGLRGGTGELSDWRLACDLRAHLASEVKLILAGGLKSENVQKAIKTVNPWALDISSGVEEAPGVKSHVKLIEFFKSVEAANE